MKWTRPKANSRQIPSIHNHSRSPEHGQLICVRRHTFVIITDVADEEILCVAVGLAVLYSIHSSGGNVDRRAELLGQGLGTLTVFVIAPFWIYGAWKFGRERREAQNNAWTKPASRRRKPGS
jgi:hypothetical protein